MAPTAAASHPGIGRFRVAAAGLRRSPPRVSPQNHHIAGRPV